MNGIFFEMVCWKCRYISHVYCIGEDISYSENYECRSPGHVLTVCGLSLWDIRYLRINEFSPEIIKAVRDFSRTEKGMNIKMGEIRPRFMKMRGKHMSFGCIRCDAVFGPHFVRERYLEASDVRTEHGFCTVFDAVITPHISLTDIYPHWCLSRQKVFCE